jgi:glycosyltransferase involved in cell wall biosynthesis
MAGVPLVVSDIPVLREVLLSAEGSPVRFVDTADAACLARDIGAVLGSQAARDSARAFAETIVERYRPEPMIEAYVKLLAGGGVRP